MNKFLDDFNLWNKELDFGVDRLFAYPKIVELLNRKEIQVITGIRRCGKTTLMRQCMRHLEDTGINKQDILFVPCDNPLLTLKTIGQLDMLIKEYVQKTRLYVFLDEIQVIPDWEKYLKSIYDANKNIKFVISGSTVSFFAKDVATYLTGRHFYHKIETLGFKEFLRLNPKGTLKEYVEWGGFPEVAKTQSRGEKEALLESYLSTIMQRDIVERNDIRDEKKLRDLLESILQTVGGKINVVKLSKQLKLNTRTVERYIEFGKDSFLLQEVPFFSYSKRKNRHMLPKLYPADIGLARILSKRFEEGRSIEWAVMHRLGNASYWSDSSHEIDFVTDDLAIQVTSSKDIPKREQAAFDAFKNKQKRKLLLLGPQTTNETTAIEEFLL
jgi:hypothetical protein